MGGGGGVVSGSIVTRGACRFMPAHNHSHVLLHFPARSQLEDALQLDMARPSLNEGWAHRQCHSIQSFVHTLKEVAVS